MAQIFNGTVYSNSPGISETVNYEYYRDGANMRYHFWGNTRLNSSGGWYYNNVQTKLYLNGSNVYTKDCKSSNKGWSIDWDAGWHTVSNKTSGTTPFYFTVKDTQNTGWCNYTSGTYQLDITAATTSVSQSLNSKTAYSITMNWSTGNTADYIWYSKDNGSNWIAVGSVNASSGTYTISGLNANTAYNIKTRARRKDTGVNTNYSGTTSVTTYKVYSTVSSVTVSNIQPFSCTAYCTSSNASNTNSYEYALCDANKAVLQTYTSTATTYNFTGLSEETTYYIRCRVKSSDSGVWSGYSYSSVFATTADQAKGYIKINGVWTLGKVYIKIDGNWVKAKKAYLKYSNDWNISKNP